MYIDDLTELKTKTNQNPNILVGHFSTPLNPSQHLSGHDEVTII